MTLLEPVDVTYLDALNVFGCVALVTWYLLTKNWIANNIIAASFSIQGIALVSVGSYQIGCGLLSLLFFYDIFWVFGTDVMVTVARSFDGPIKMLWPKNLLAESYSFSMLGLGDIVLPGLFLALLLRYDVHRSKDQKAFRSPYFNVTFIGYIIGLAVTMGVMHIFRAAQPALLYLVPACLIFSSATSLFLKDFNGLWNYSEDNAEKEKKD
jgi:minor histocompatibility antigen H13